MATTTFLEPHTNTPTALTPTSSPARQAPQRQREAPVAFPSSFFVLRKQFPTHAKAFAMDAFHSPG